MNPLFYVEPKLETVDVIPPTFKQLLVIASDLSEQIYLGESLTNYSDVYFSSSLESLRCFEPDALILVGLDGILDKQESALLGKTIKRLEYLSVWLDARDLQAFELLKTFERLVAELSDRRLSICAVDTNDFWLCLELKSASEDAVSAEPFFRGLTLGQEFNLSNRDRTQSVASVELSPPSLRRRLVKLLFRVGKPIKSYLPSKLISVVYRLLNR